MKPNIYAIDFGTTNSLLAGANNEHPFDPIPLDSAGHSPAVLRSTMYFSKQGPVSFGHSAIKAYLEESGEGRFLRSIKRFLPLSSFTSTNIHQKSYSLENLIGRFLRELKKRADNHFEIDCKRVLLGRPARFSLVEKEDQLAQTRLEKAAQEAGFDEIHFFPEPLAAAFDYRRSLQEEKVVLIVDLGGGTSDFTVIRLRPKGYSDSDVLSLGGVSIAGDALDGSIMGDIISPHFGAKVKYRFPMSSNTLEMPASLKFHLRSPAEITMLQRSHIHSFLMEVKKSTLSIEDEQKMENLFVLVEDNLGFKIFDAIETSKIESCQMGISELTFDYSPIEIHEELTYENFLGVNQENIQKIFATLDETVKSAQVTAKDIDLICCTGGTAQVPEVRKQLEIRFGPQKIQTMDNFQSVINGLSQRAIHLI